jgi:class 3 adenylate cyclase
VHLARDTRLDREVAQAVITTEGLDDETRVRVQREAQAMGRLGDHPHIVTAYDVGEESGTLYIVTPYLSGGGLDERLRSEPEGRLPVADSIRIASELLAALDHAHGAGIVHRDVKPGNVWLSGDGTARLGDFGLALSSHRSRLTQEGMMVGTAAYMPPEQALSGEVTARSDLYAFGATLYEMVTGRPPFSGDDLVAVIGQHINTPPVAPRFHNPEVPPALESLILRLLAKNPNERPESAAAARDALVAVSAVREVPTGEGANPLDRLSQGVFVGREAELAQLREAIDATLTGQGRILLLVGEPGIGKTRTSEELTTYAAMRGAGVIWGRCYEGEGAPAYWPWVQVVRTHVQQSDAPTLLEQMGAGASSIADVVSEVRERLPGLQAAPELEPDEARFRLFDSLTSFLKAASQSRPLMIVLDDLHWADKPSLLLLQFLARELAGSRIAVLATYRDVELRRTHPLSEALAELVRMEGTERVTLRGIGEQDVARFIELTTGKAPPQGLSRAVHRETEGNPFFVHEVVRLLASDGRLEQNDQVSSWSVSLPQGIREVIGQRLNGLSEECNKVLTTASVIGREFDLAVLERVAGGEGDDVLERVEEAVAGRVVEEMPGAVARFRFAHALIRETLQEELSTTRRVRLHRRIGEVLETYYAEGAERHLAELAYHAVEGAHGGGDVTRAVDYATRAARRSAEIEAWEDAIPHFERALQAMELLESTDPAQRIDLLIELGNAQITALGTDEADTTLSEAVDLARAAADPERLAQAAGLLCQCRWELGRANPESVALLHEGLAGLDGRDCAEAVELKMRLYSELVLTDYGQAIREASEAAEMARRLGDERLLLRAFTGRLDDLREDVDEIRSRCRERILLADKIGTRGDRVMARIIARIPELTRGNRAEFERLLAEEAKLLENTQNTYAAGMHGWGQGMLALLDCDYAEAERLSTENFAVSRRFAGPAAVQMFGVQTIFRLLPKGEWDQVLALLRMGASEHAQPAWRAALAPILAILGQEEEAREVVRECCADDMAAIYKDGNWWAAIAGLVRAVAVLQDREHAEVLYRNLAPFPRRMVFVGLAAATHGSTSELLGLLCTELERFDEGIAHFEEGLVQTRALGSRYHEAQTLIGWSDLHARRDAPGDRDRALELVNEALELARRFEMDGSVEIALQRKLELQGISSGDVQGSIYSVTASVRNAPNDFTTQAAPDGTVTLMFSDMEGFTSMTERLGDLSARDVIRAHNRIVREQLATHGGYEVELQGDGFLLAFGSARKALHCAIGIQRAMESHSLHADEPIRVRIGLHTGEALRDADKFFGKTVILASRIAAQAKGGEILVSELLRALTESSGDLTFGASRTEQLKGIAEPQRLHEVVWAPQAGDSRSAAG